MPSILPQTTNLIWTAIVFIEPSNLVYVLAYIYYIIKMQSIK